MPDQMGGETIELLVGDAHTRNEGPAAASAYA